MDGNYLLGDELSLDLLCDSAGKRYVIMECGIELNGWFTLLFVGVLIAAVFSKSLILNLALIFVSVLGWVLAMELADVSDMIMYGLVVLFVSVMGFAVIQIGTRIERI